MKMSDLPLTRDLVLIGGGHTHALVLHKWAMDPLPGARVTLINPGPTAPYSGMLPGFVAGHYTRRQLNVDLVQLARKAGARLIMDAASGIDPARRVIHLRNGPDVGFDVAAVDVGITSVMPDLPGFAEHGVPAKPLGRFAERWADYVRGTNLARVAVLGGGVAGAELALAMAHRLRVAGRDAQIRVIDRSRALTAVGPKAARQVRRAFERYGIEVMEGCAPARLSAEGVTLTDGRVVEADFITGAAGAKPHDWMAETGLANEAGFIPVDSRLRSRDPSVFAVGDCADMTASPRPKAGVYAVRQAPVLFDNLRAALSTGTGLREYVPQRDYLKLISLGEKSALAERFGVTLAGPMMWRWKDQIDTKFMTQFDAPMGGPAPALPWPRAKGASVDQPLCGGCGAKVGMPALTRALGRDGAVGEDAGLLPGGQVISTDHLRAMVLDPVTQTRIAAVHALGDIWAMGATPQAALSTVIVPQQSPELAERVLREIDAAARDVMGAAGAEIVGGHSTLGAEMTVGFTVTGLCEGAPITLEGARPGDALVVTKPIGSGVVMAAEMAAEAQGADVAQAYEVMMQPQGIAAGHLSGAHAMTDVTGFGLAGHVMNMVQASGVGAEIHLDAVPLMAGALALSERGVRSSLFAQNRAILPDVEETALSALLFDPQTGGGLLAALGGDADAVVARLRAEGYDAAVIGRITDQAGQVSIV
ncbi:MAG: selenide, water dikinase SelD [Pseudomonadota bacterium]